MKGFQEFVPAFGLSLGAILNVYHLAATAEYWIFLYLATVPSMFFPQIIGKKSIPYDTSTSNQHRILRFDVEEEFCPLPRYKCNTRCRKCRKSNTSSSHIDSPRLSIDDGIDPGQFDAGAIDGSDSNTGTAKANAWDHNYSLVS